MKKTTVYLSYRGEKDIDLVRSIRDRLIALGVDVFFDDEIDNDRFHTVIKDEIRKRDYFFFMLEWPPTELFDWSLREFDTAHDSNKRILVLFPIPLDSSQFDLESSNLADVISYLKEHRRGEAVALIKRLWKEQFSTVFIDHENLNTAIRLIREYLDDTSLRKYIKRLEAENHELRYHLKHDHKLYRRNARLYKNSIIAIFALLFCSVTYITVGYFIVEPTPIAVIPTTNTPAYPPTPRLLHPTDGVDIVGGLIRFEWEWEGQLAENEYFDLKIRPIDDPASIFVDWSKETTYLLDTQHVPFQETMQYEWTIQIIKGHYNGEEKQFEEFKSPESEPFILHIEQGYSVVDPGSDMN